MTLFRNPTCPTWTQITSSYFLKWILTITVLGLLILFYISKYYEPTIEVSSPVSYPSCLSEDVQTSLLNSEIIYSKYKSRRNERVNSNPKSVDPWAPHTYPYDYFLATFNCPLTVQRIGDLGDGGKWICGVELYQNFPCILYSFGISTEASFELEMLKTTTCEIFAFDASVDEVIGIPPELKDRLHFYKLFLGNKDTEDHVTLGSIMTRHGHDHIDIIKMDIEGHEHSVFNQILQQFGTNLPFTQLLIEIHAEIITGSEFAKLYRFFEKLENVGLRPFRNELNIAQMVQKKHHTTALSEYSFININRFCKL